jgi:hypothetical protein
MMFKPNPIAEQSSRPWRKIAEEMSHEFDNQRLNNLAEELCSALKKAEQEEKGKRKSAHT